MSDNDNNGGALRARLYEMLRDTKGDMLNNMRELRTLTSDATTGSELDALDVCDVAAFERALDEANDLIVEALGIVSQLVERINDDDDTCDDDATSRDAQGDDDVSCDATCDDVRNDAGGAS